MDRLIVITLLALGVLSYAEEQNTAEQFSLDELVDKLADDDFQNKLVDKFVDRAHEKLNNLDLELEDTLLAKDAKSAPPPPKRSAARRAPAPAPKKSGNIIDGFFEGLSNLGNSGGGVTPTVGRAGRGNLKNTGMTEIKALPEMSRRGFPQTVPRQNAFAGGARGPRVPFEETLAESDETTSASSSMLGLCVMAFFVGMAVTYAAVSFRRGKSTADEEYKPM